MLPPDNTLPAEKGGPGRVGSAGEGQEAIEDSPEATARGKELYERYCAVCHGLDATGRDLGEDFVEQDLTESDYLELSDRSIYNVIVEGGLSMPSYRSEIGRRDPWLVVNYLRTLQRAANEQ